MSFISKIIESGCNYAERKSEERNIRLTNCISILTSITPALLITGRYFSGNLVNEPQLGWIVSCSIIFLFPLFLNGFGFIRVSRIVLSWVPSTLVMWITVMTIQTGGNPQPSDFVGVRFFLMAFGFTPFFIFNVKSLPILSVSLIGSLFPLLFFDYILNYFYIGFHDFGFADTSYEFNRIRILISSLIIGLGIYFVKKYGEENEEQNEILLSELAAKNDFIRQQSDNELHQLNDQLRANLQQLSEREFILSQSQRIAKIGSWEYRIENTFLFWSEEMYNIFGLDKSNVLKLENLEEALGAEGGKSVTQATNELLKSGRSYDLTFRTRTPLGYNKWFRIYAYPIIDKQLIVGVRGVCHDITFFKEAEKKLRASEAKFSKAFENYPDFIMLVREEDLLVVDVNQRITSILGFEKNEVIGRSARAMDLFLTEEDRQKFIQGYNESGYFECECHWKRKDGRIIQVSITAIRIVIEGQYYRMSVVQDITERKAAEEKFLKAFDLSPDLMVIFRERDLVVVEANKKIEEISGYKREEVIGFSSQAKGVELWNSQEQKELFFKAYNHSGSIALETELHKKNGELFHASVSAKRITMSEENHMLVIIRDITQKKEDQRRLILSQANLNATINNTEVLIWSVDRNLKLMMFNRPFFNFIKEHYDIEIILGARVLEPLKTSQNEEADKRWESYYFRALSGEIVTQEESLFGIDLHYSLNPIIEEGNIIGVSVFADNVTERNARGRELSEATKKIGELKLMALRSVMSPHFIFNVLNSIQFFIAKNDRLNAINYLSTFSKLIRSILTHSVDNKIKLVEEIDMLKNYIQLEMVRFESKFNFVLNVDPTVDADAIEIPSLLVQPYVENAILHGLYNKETAGTLTIRIAEKDNMLIFEIEDDGIGRAAAQKLRQQNFPGHKSIGLKVTEERLKLINEHHNVSFEIEDLMDESHQPLGTKVRIWIAI